MTIGSHFLEGKIHTLAKPFLVTEDTNIENIEEDMENIEEVHTSKSKSLNIIGIAYKKILFNTRPRLI